jgi:dTDP-4-amino-4,6-dideoxygalactose transaminase
LPSELNAAYLTAQLEAADQINENRLHTWNLYFDGLKNLEDKGYIKLPFIPQGCKHNAHMFYIKCKDINERTDLIKYLKEREIATVFHYIPLHSSVAGKKYSRFSGEDKYTTIESEKLLRLPLYYDMQTSDVKYVIEKVKEYYQTK